MSIPVDIPHGGREDKSGVVSDIFSLLFPFPREQQSGNGPSGIRDFTYSWQELEISPAEVERDLGFIPGETPEPFAGMVLSALEEAPSLFEPRAGFRVLAPVLFDNSRRVFRAGNHTFFPGKIIFTQIKNGDALLFFAATAGEAVTVRCRNLNDAGDQVYSYVLDTLGSVVAEKASERMMEWLETQLAPAIGPFPIPTAPGIATGMWRNNKNSSPFFLPASWESPCCPPR